MKTVTLPASTWQDICRHLNSAVGSHDETRKWAACIQEQTSGAIRVKALSGGNTRARAIGPGVDLRKSAFLK